MKVNNVLYVEDDKSWRGTMQRAFARDICPDVDTAEDYQSGLEKAREKRYDLIVLDGLEGACFALHEELKGKHGVIVIFSGEER